MADKENIIKCPECGTEINVSDILYHKVRDQLKKDYETKNAKKDREYQKMLLDLQVEKDQLAKDKITIQQKVESALKTRLDTEKTKLEKSIRKQVEDDKSEQLNLLEKELKLKSEQLRELNRTKGELARVQREKDELKETIEAENEKKFSELLMLEKEKIKSVETEKSKTELQKRDKLIEDLNKRLEDAQTKLATGSNKLSGEVKEIELRDYLILNFPFDEIKDVPSGVTGADVYQIVRNNVGQPSGIILYERKQTMSFNREWISKLKDDGRKIKADICVIVTKAMPKDKNETHFNDGVWVCNFEDIKIITTLLRDGLLKQYSALASQSDKGTKMEMLYDYLRSNDFQNHIVGIIDAFKKMDKALDKEKDDSLKRFAERESHIYQAKKSVISFWGRVDGIATDSLNQDMKVLESTTLKELSEQ
jgi:hypothetical protein